MRISDWSSDVCSSDLLSSMKAAAGAGARWVEFDVMLTADGEPVLFHDDTLQRTTGVAGEMAKNPFALLPGVDASPRFVRHSGVPRGMAFAIRTDRSEDRRGGNESARQSRNQWE